MINTGTAPKKLAGKKAPAKPMKKGPSDSKARMAQEDYEIKFDGNVNSKKAVVKKVVAKKK